MIFASGIWHFRFSDLWLLIDVLGFVFVDELFFERRDAILFWLIDSSIVVVEGNRVLFCVSSLTCLLCVLMFSATHVDTQLPSTCFFCYRNCVFHHNHGNMAPSNVHVGGNCVFTCVAENVNTHQHKHVRLDTQQHKLHQRPQSKYILKKDIIASRCSNTTSQKNTIVNSRY